MKKKDVIQEFKDNPPDSSISFNATRLLHRKLNQFINATMKNRPQKVALANLYRHLIRYTVEMNTEIDRIEAELLSALKEGESVYIPDGREKITKTEDELILTQIEDTKNEWKKAYKQMEKLNEENKGSTGS